MLPTIACHLCALVGARNGAKPSTDPPEAARRKGPEKGPRPNNLNVSVIEIGGSICEGPIGPLVPPCTGHDMPVWYVRTGEMGRVPGL